MAKFIQLCINEGIRVANNKVRINIEDIVTYVDRTRDHGSWVTIRGQDGFGVYESAAQIDQLITKAQKEEVANG